MTMNPIQLTVALAAVALLAGCKRQAAPAPAPPPVAVVVAPVVQKAVPIFLEAVGQTEARETVEIRARVQGFLTKAAFKEGSLVKSNDLLFEIDPRPFQAALDQARAELDGSLASLEKAEADVSRLKPLVGSDAVPKQDFDNAEAARKVAAANVAQSQASLTNAALNLSFTEMRAPFDGMIGARNADVGSLVGTTDNSLLATVSTVDPMRVSYSASEADYLMWMRRYGATEAEREAKGATLEFSLILGDGSTYPHKGRFDFAERALDPRTGTLKVRVLFPNPDGLLRPGQFGRVRMKADEMPDALLVPQRAVTEIQNIKSVLVVGEDNKVQQRSVQLGERFENDFLVLGGVKAGERVIVEGLQKALPGAAVTPMDQPATSATPATR